MLQLPEYLAAEVGPCVGCGACAACQACGYCGPSPFQTAQLVNVDLALLLLELP